MSFNFITFVNNGLMDGLNNRSKLLAVFRNSDLYAKSTTWRRKLYETNKLLLIDLVSNKWLKMFVYHAVKLNAYFKSIMILLYGVLSPASGS